MTRIMQTGQQLLHRYISHSVSSADLIGPCLTTQPRIHILKISDATWGYTVSTIYNTLSTIYPQWRIQELTNGGGAIFSRIYTHHSQPRML